MVWSPSGDWRVDISSDSTRRVKDKKGREREEERGRERMCVSRQKRVKREPDNGVASELVVTPFPSLPLAQ